MARKILVVSDSHGRNGNLQKAVSLFGEKGEELEMLIHLGDMGGLYSEIRNMVSCPLEAVRGNGDFNQELPISKLITIGDQTALITHGHRYNCKAGTDAMRGLARANGASMVFFGHTHQPLVEIQPEIKMLNPGSITLPRQPGYRPTYMVVTIEEDGRIQFSVVEM
ncbi:MAG: metallophosphoesterase [Clostridiaceae bacterium]|nr:metallophosphoesterase [Clostridiaceae bacterium]